MKIQAIDTYKIAVPLKKPFKTALRTVTVAEAVFVRVVTTDGITGWGEAPPTHVITGDSLASIEYAIQHIFKPLLLGKSLLAREELFQLLDRAAIGNTSAKAAVDIALHDCFAQQVGLPLYQLLGGYRNHMETDFTVSVDTPEVMAEDARRYQTEGFTVLKIKVGKDDIKKDIKRIKAIRKSVGKHMLIRLDANQGWSAKTAVRAIRQMEDAGLCIELVEQPVKAHDIDGLKYVTDHVLTPVMADESVFSPVDARKVLETHSADLINIKLMKAGGIYQAEKIVRLAESFGVECMIGSMIETKLGITAAAHLAASLKNITRYDFDSPLMLAEDIVTGGVAYKGKTMHLPGTAGLGVLAVDMGTDGK